MNHPQRRNSNNHMNSSRSQKGSFLVISVQPIPTDLPLPSKAPMSSPSTPVSKTSLPSKSNSTPPAQAPPTPRKANSRMPETSRKEIVLLPQLVQPASSTRTKEESASTSTSGSSQLPFCLTRNPPLQSKRNRNRKTRGPRSCAEGKMPRPTTEWLGGQCSVLTIDFFEPSQGNIPSNGVPAGDGRTA